MLKPDKPKTENKLTFVNVPDVDPPAPSIERIATPMPPKKRHKPN